MARKTTTTTVVHSDKDSSGNWREKTRSVTTVVERDDDGYPYGPIDNLFYGSQYAKNRYGQIGDFLGWYGSFGARPTQKPEDGKDV